ncbi:MAG: two pore domain potassium channel family protein [Actinomycetales bacterium]|nr:two pore domain potassium channel family protein [Actinomycetales bacterium]
MRMPSNSRRAVLATIARCAATALALVLAYVLLPIGVLDFAPALFFVLAAALFAVVLTYQLRAIVRSPTPVLQAAEAVAALLVLSVVSFAGVYAILSAGDPTAFTEVLDKVDAVYFSVTVLTTVGFGDIAAVTTPARIAVTVQMLIDLVMVAGVVRAITSATRRGREHR